MLPEFLFLVLLFMAGGLTIYSLGLSGWGVGPVGFLVGIYLWIVFGVLYVVLGFSTNPKNILIPLVVLVLINTVHLIRKGNGMRELIGPLSVYVTIIWLVVWLTNNYGLVKYHIDSFRYLLSAGLLSEDNFTFANENLLVKRGLATPLLHMPSSLYGGFYVASITPMLSISTVGAMAWLLTHGFHANEKKELLWSAVALVVMLAITNNRYVWNSFYINGHLFVGSALLMLTGSIWLMDRRNDCRSYYAYLLSALSVAVLIVARPEGFIIAMLGIIPILALPEKSELLFRLLLLVFGLFCTSWNAYIIVELLGSGKSVTSFLAIAVVLGSGGIMASIFPIYDRLRQNSVLLLRLFELSLWAFLCVASFYQPELTRESLSATFKNLIGGSGSWGSSFILMVLLTFSSIWMARSKNILMLRFPLTAMVPIFLLLAHLRESAYRVGNGDSLNRMVFELFPLAVFLIGVLLSDILAEHNATRNISKNKGDSDKTNHTNSLLQ
ncbi:hypothetical protein CR161_08630 [Prosthecochloris sp. ZM]|uniref:hypothetical protein n=1 Tax=Prosthecochloris sp. ZM TaxID=2283143 RepID=UPI000DF75868|nr:hypothetical protein [Prosthecochloris sp. ZM]RDD30764.1 hypothetical protein CR161_08630 [Prosthecochloris sp. ZM]